MFFSLAKFPRLNAALGFPLGDIFIYFYKYNEDLVTRGLNIRMSMSVCVCVLYKHTAAHVHVAVCGFN